MHGTLPSDPVRSARRRDRLAAWLLAGAIRRMDAAFAHGRLDALLPDGSVRTLGGRGPGPQASLTIRRWRALARLMLAGSIGWYEGWLAGEWDSPDRPALFAAFSANAAALGQAGRARGPLRWAQRWWHARQHNDRAGSRRNIAAHYDLGNDFYTPWLDDHLVYSSARFIAPDQSLEDAQLAKIDAVLDRLQLHPGDALLEIGCGWGALGARAIERHGARYTGLTLSEEQAAIARPLVGAAGDIALRDYRDERGRYDAIASVEMVEAVGQAYWPAYLDAIADRLKTGGRAAIQYIAIDDQLFDAYAAGADFIQRYIFPGGCLIAETHFAALAEARGLSWTDVDRFGADYARTLSLWRDRFDAALAAGRLPPRFDAAFQRMWRYYLDYCEGGFTGGSIWVGQVTLIKQGERG
jgi:cyclopropane-fatty-acyl-phospholipid synthase